MSATLVPDMVQSGLLQVKNAVARRPLHPTEADILELLSGCEIAANLIAALGKYLESLLAVGVEKNQLAVILDRAASALDTAVPVLRSFSTAEPGTPARTEQHQAALARITAAADEASALKEKVEPLRQWLNKPRPLIDLARLPVSEEDIQRGTYKTLDEVLADL